MKQEEIDEIISLRMIHRLTINNESYTKDYDFNGLIDALKYFAILGKCDHTLPNGKLYTNDEKKCEICGQLIWRNYNPF